MHLRQLEKKLGEQREVHEEPLPAVKKDEDNEQLFHLSLPYRTGYEACIRDVRLFLQLQPDMPVKDHLLDHLSAKLSNNSNDTHVTTKSIHDPSSDVNVTPTRLSDGRLALVFSSPCHWLSVNCNKGISPSPSTSHHSNFVPATPPCSPPFQKQSSPPVALDSNVWRPW